MVCFDLDGSTTREASLNRLDIVKRAASLAASKA